MQFHNFNECGRGMSQMEKERNYKLALRTIKKKKSFIVWNMFSSFFEFGIMTLMVQYYFGE